VDPVRVGGEQTLASGGDGHDIVFDGAGDDSILSLVRDVEAVHGGKATTRSALSAAPAPCFMEMSAPTR
jgi:hypothetical protein